MDKVKSVLVAIGVLIAVAAWIILFPEVEQYRENGRCYETTTYVGLFSRLEEVRC